MADSGSPRRPAATLVVVGASEILTCCRDAIDKVGRISAGVVAIIGERVFAVGPESAVATCCDLDSARRIDANGESYCPVSSIAILTWCSPDRAWTSTVAGLLA